MTLYPTPATVVGTVNNEGKVNWLLVAHVGIVGATKLHHIEGAVKSLDLHLTAEDIAYLEEPYVPHNLSGVMAVNKPIMSEDPVWVTARRNK